jgi:hypothetical protein
VLLPGSWSGVFEPAISIVSPRAGVELEMLDVERDELSASQRGSEPDKQQRPVTHPGARGGVDRLD